MSEIPFEELVEKGDELSEVWSENGSYGVERERSNGKMESVGEMDRLLREEWRDFFTDENYDEWALMTEESGVGSVPDNVEMVVLTDELDGSSLVSMPQTRGVVSTALTFVEVDEVRDREIVGTPVGSYIFQFEDSQHYFSNDGEAWVKGEFGDMMVEEPTRLPLRRNGSALSPMDIDLSDIDEGEEAPKISAYAGKESRMPVMNNFFLALSSESNLDDPFRYVTFGGSVNGASVGLGDQRGNFAVAAEPKPTFPYEMAGMKFSEDAGAELIDIYGDPWDTINVTWDENGELNRDFNGLVVAPGNVDFAVDAINQHGLEEAYGSENYERV